MTDTTSDPIPTDRLVAMLNEQRRELDALRGEVDRLRQGRAPHDIANAPTGGSGAVPTPRRNMLRAVGAAAAGAALAAPVAASLGARPAAAADSDPLIIGGQNFGSTTTELFSGTANEPNKSVLGVADASREIDIEAAVSGMATGSSVSNGVVGFTSDPGPTVESGHALVAYPLDLPNETPPRSNLWIRPQLPDPRTSDLEHTPGEIVSDRDGDLWHCVVRGTPGEWRRISGAVTAGAFVPITPSRVYDSRRTGGQITFGTERLVSVADFVDVFGNPVESDGVPPGATAIAYNLAVVNTNDRGFLFVAPGDATVISASTINWDIATTGAVTTGSIVKLDPGRRVRVFCDGEAFAATDFIIDVVGYYL